MNNKRREFEKRLEEAHLSDEQKERYRRLGWELLRLRVINGITKVAGWVEKIKPLVVPGKENGSIAFKGSINETHKRVVTNVAGDKNILTSIASGEAVLEPLKCRLSRLCVFAAYLPNNENNPLLPELSATNVLRQMPENVPVGKAQYFEVRFNSDKPEAEYDEILQAHKVKVILYAPAHNPLERLNAVQQQLPSEKKEEKQNEQSAPLLRKQDVKKPEKKKNPCRDVPQRQY